ncbi:LPS-assembly protein LptD [Flavobacteriaceae bacterium TP-CH-4]|uniref:LPS-assembly protein LptD n=1 Tax=Pelagihabitans pacificus TaxID=2696054 RepID=A0A967AXG2_9FLAO|nr:putative LPS assembly protein LptD [Pelagihabitans pacificus]NHF61100.1 LPS-assembly protein LptD [Pelagihabitans pacificus]
MQSNKHHLLFLFLLLIGTLTVSSQEDGIVTMPIKAEKDTIVAPLFPISAIRDSTVTDSTRIDSLNKKQSILLDKIKYKAKDYVRLSQKDQKIYLYNEAEIYYQDTELKAGIIVMDYVNNEVYAGRLKDSLGNYSQLPFFKQGSQEVRPDSIRFNFDTQKALIWNSRTEQQADAGPLGGSEMMKVYAEITKKENDSVYFLSEGKLTTSQDTINPDYYIRVRKAKFVPKKKVIAGYSNLYIADVPTPIALPFAYFPLTVGRTAGLMMPSFGNDPNRGYFLQNGGYYLPFGEYADLTLTGDFYTNGSYGFRGQSVYAKRYKYRGNVNFRFENLVTSQRGFSDYSRTTIYNIQISHSQDTKASPNSRFSASVNLGSSSYYQNSLNQLNTGSRLNNTLNSSISYSKTFPEYPSVNMSLTMTHSQNTTAPEGTDNIQMTLPTLQASMERIFPFAKRDGIKKGAIQNINFQYDVNAQNRLTTNDDDFLTGRMFDNALVGARHRVPISTNFKIAKFFSVTMGGTYEDIWALETYGRSYQPGEDGARGSVVIDTMQGFDRFNKYGLSTSIGTTLYGTFLFGEDKKIQAIRHVMRPSISYGYTPSFEQFFDEYVNTDTDEIVQYTRFQGTLNGAPSLGKSSSVGFSLANTFEAKVRDKDSTKLEPKKIPLLSNLNLSTAYNFEADSLNLSPININGGTTITVLDQNMSINFGAALDAYALDNNGRRINTFNIDNGGSLFRLTRANLNIGYNISNKTFARKEGEEEDEEEVDPYDYVAQSGGRDDDLFGSPESLYGDQGGFKDRDSEDVENPVYGTKIPWDFRLAYAATYSNPARQNEFSAHSLMVSGNISLSPRWRIGGNSGYDFKNKGVVNTNLRIERDLKSFTMRFNWTPFGRFRQWNFFIGIKASILKDLKWENRSQPFRQ